MVERWNRWVVDHPWLVLIVVMLVAGASGWSARSLQINNDPRIFFTEDNPDYKRFRELEDRFTANELVLFVVAPRDGDVFGAEALSALESLTEDAWTLP